MLAALTIRDVVLIDRLVLEFAPGLSTLTGETGAGKSILLDALGLALGSRGDVRLVRSGARQASISAAFDVPADHPAAAILAKKGIDAGEDGIIVLRRVLGSDGRSRAYVNDQPVGVALLRRIGESLVEIHGQFESQRLLEPASHRRLLDAYGELSPFAAAVGSTYRAWRQAAEERRRCELELAAARRDEDDLRHAAQQLEALDPRPGEEAQLAERRALLMNGEKIIAAIDEAARALAGDGSARSPGAVLRCALRALSRVADKADGKLDATIAALDHSASEAEEAEALLERAAADLDLDPRRLEDVEERLFALRALARKHACSVDDLPRVRDDIQARLQAVEDGGDRLNALIEAERAAEVGYLESAERLSAARAAAAGRLDAAVNDELAPLRLGGARFQTRIELLDPPAWGEHGRERITFEVATNPGTPPGPLTRIASGGELARFMLALKVVLARADPVPTLIFDEVDAGIGGAVAAAVGERLARLAEEVQVLVVTHSPQVAARGAHHLRVVKSAGTGGTSTSVEALEETARTEEIARMLAGARVTDEARAAADSLLHGTCG